MELRDSRPVSQEAHLLAHPFREAASDLSGIVLEEIELHDFGDAQQQGAVEGRFAEDFIDMVACARYLASQPAHAAVVPFQLFLNEVPDVNGARICLVCFHKKPRTSCWRLRFGKTFYHKQESPR